MITLGVLADTHIPDRHNILRPQVKEIFQQTKVSAILHAGDVSTPMVLNDLAQIAPVYAVRGNRDLFRLWNLPSSHLLHFGGYHIWLTHGHGNIYRYLLNKFQFYTKGYQFEFYRDYLLQQSPPVDVIVYGHSHVAVTEWVGDKLIFNPGSACCGSDWGHPASVGLLEIEFNKSISARVMPLE